MKRFIIGLFSLLLFSGMTHAQTTTSYSANTIPVGGNYSTAFGLYALRSNTSYFNTATGYSALYNNSTGTGNTATGHASMFYNTMGNANTASGYFALESNTTGSYNCAHGYQALYSNSTGGSNSAFGYQALYNNTTASQNTAFGYLALTNNTTASQNTAFGYLAQCSNRTGIGNVAVGAFASLGNSFKNGNTGVGVNALRENTNGSYNTEDGWHDGSGADDLGSFNTVIGTYLFLSSGGNIINNGTSISGSITANDNNKVVIGNESVTSIGGQVGWTIYSDARVKNNFKKDVPGLSFISLLKPVSYNYNIAKEKELLGIKNDNREWPGKNNIEQIKFSGFIAQAVDSAAQKIGYDFSGVDKSGNIMGLRYDDFVVPLAKAIQEQQAQIDELKKIIASGSFAGSTAEPGDKDTVALNQNTPNPFTKQTVISYSVPLMAASAQLFFYDASGRLISAHNITERGRGLITVAANDLSIGVYNYTLVVDGKIAGTKQLIKQ